MRRRETWMCLAAMLAWGCRGTVVDHVPLDLALPDAPECHAAIGPITLTALGDFPTTDQLVTQLDSSGAPIDPVTRFFDSSLAFSASAHATTPGWDAFGWATRGSLGDDPALVMRPLGLSCPLADPEARLPVGAAMAVIDEARVMFVGGLDELGDTTNRVAVLHVRDERVELPRLDRVMPRIAFASATLVPEGDAVLVSGGASTASGEGRDTWLRIPLDGSAATFGLLEDGRRDHASIAVDAGAVHGVLLVGGSNGSEVLRSIEWVDPGTQTGGVLSSMLGVGRISPTLVPLDGSQIAIVGGFDMHGVPLAAIEVLDVADDRIASFSIPLGVPDWLAPLPSGRVAWASASALSVLSLGRDRVDAAGMLPSVLDPVAVGLPSGRVLLEGHRADGSRLGYLIDLGAGTTTAIATSRVPRDLVTLPDGTTIELASAGASLRRDERLTPFDSPPPSYLFAADAAALSLDAASRWTTSAGVLAPATDGARLDLPVLRFAHFDALFDAAGAYDVLLTGDHLETLATIAVTDEAITYGACTFARVAADGRLRIERGVGDTVLVRTEHGAGACSQVEPALRVGIGIVAHTGAALRSLALQRDLGAH